MELLRSFLASETIHASAPVIRPFMNGKALFRYVKRIKRHRMPFAENKVVFGSKLLHDGGTEMPQVSGNIVGTPHFFVFFGIE